jgi:hypothetical protein
VAAAAHVVWVNETREAYFPYDIVATTFDGGQKFFVEVKTTQAENAAVRFSANGEAVAVGCV